MQKRYQIFVSSTYSDLKAQRNAIKDAILEAGDIPVGMETFPALDEDQLDFIEKEITSSDYYCLLIGNRYGSISRNGISFTEEEYNLATKHRIKVIALIHSNPDQISFEDSDSDIHLRTKLEKFRERVGKTRLVKHWNSTDELALRFTNALSKAKYEFPATGWLRGDAVASQQLLTDMEKLRKENHELIAKNRRIEDDLNSTVWNEDPLRDPISPMEDTIAPLSSVNLRDMFFHVAMHAHLSCGYAYMDSLIRKRICYLNSDINIIEDDIPDSFILQIVMRFVKYDLLDLEKQFDREFGENFSSLTLTKQGIGYLSSFA